jgi:hypothetical protein
MLTAPQGLPDANVTVKPLITKYNVTARLVVAHSIICSSNADPPLSGFTMLACVLQTAKNPRAPSVAFKSTAAAEGLKMFFIRERKNMSRGMTSLLSPLDYGASSSPNIVALC